MRVSTIHHRLSTVLLFAAICLLPSAVYSQSRIQTNREELSRLREERAQLEQRLRQLQGTASNIREERSNLERQAVATARLVRSLDRQILDLANEMNDVTAKLELAQEQLVRDRATLRRRVRDIYKRGPLHSLEALLSAQSFGALVARYKYLHLVAQRDQELVQRVELLNEEIEGTRTQLEKLHGEMALSRAQKNQEVLRLRTLEGQRGKALARVQQSAKETQARLQQIQRDEKRLTDLIAAFEAERRRAAAARPNVPSVPSLLRTSDFGRLDWPVEGQILYRFGRVVNPNNTTTRWNGIGIGALEGTAVKAVAGGQVVLAEAFGTYGQTVIVSHGDGDFSVYGSLARLDVRKGATIQKGQTIGTVGRTDPDFDAHLHFEMRPKGRAVDPLEWLRSTR